jgi:hypothetical protein
MEHIWFGKQKESLPCTIDKNIYLLFYVLFIYGLNIGAKSVNNSLLVSIETIHAPGSVDENYSKEEVYIQYY